MKLVALRHATAFLRAHAPTGAVDFQTIIPALICAVQDLHKPIRIAAFECLYSVVKGLQSGAKPTEIYSYDVVYGSGTSCEYSSCAWGRTLRQRTAASLQYLDSADQLRYLQIITDKRDHIVNDENYLISVHHEVLTTTQAEGKKDAKYTIPDSLYNSSPHFTYYIRQI